MTDRIRARLRFTLTTIVAAWSMAPGCTEESGRTGNSNTNWLRACDTNSDCGSGLSCVCSTCTRSCAIDSCRDFGPGARCLTPTPSAANALCREPGPIGALCTAGCANDADCHALGSELHCVGGACLVGSASRSREAGTVESGSVLDSGPVEQFDSGSGTTPPSCNARGSGLSNCGPTSESCCTSEEVPGGTFLRSYDGVAYKDDGNPATISGYRLDKYEISVGRFRRFVTAVIGGWRPAAGSGKHTHLNGGRGLADSSSPGSFESGWNGVWNNNLSSTATGWNTSLRRPTDVNATWTASAGGNETLPINTVNWYQVYAFCIWDGGFLPSEAEWNYAASGGSEQRVYPWSSPPASQSVDCTYANFNTGCNPAEPGGPNLVGADSPKGDGRWGQADLAGNVMEWTLDWMTPGYAMPCSDCAYLSVGAEPVSAKVQRGGFASDDYDAGTKGSEVSVRVYSDPTGRDAMYGARCARPR